MSVYCWTDMITLRRIYWDGIYEGIIIAVWHIFCHFKHYELEKSNSLILCHMYLVKTARILHMLPILSQ